MKDSVIRTLVPVIYALLLRTVAKWLGLDEPWLNSAAALIATGIVYVAIRAGEQWRSQIGWLLGSAKQPVYVKGEVVNQVTDAAAAISAGQVQPASTVVPASTPVVEVDPELDEDPPS